jgi:hypothetical protein
MGITRAERCLKFGEHQIETACRSYIFDQLTDTRAIVAVGVARSGGSRHTRMAGRDRVGRYHPLSMAFGLEDLFEGMIANGR